MPPTLLSDITIDQEAEGKRAVVVKFLNENYVRGWVGTGLFFRDRFYDVRTDAALT
jgi:hypothetical protein